MKYNIEWKIITKVLKLRLHYFLQIGLSVYVKFRRTIEHPKGRNKSYKAKAMVAVQVRNKNMTQAIGFDTRLAHSYLGSFSAINHVLFIPDYQ